LLYWSLLPICDGPPTCQKIIHLKGKQLAAAIEFILNPNPLPIESV
jgi:hypothetical protein